MDEQRVTVDTSHVEAALTELSADLGQGFTSAFTAAKAIVRGDTRRRFLSGGQGAWPSVTEETIRRRRVNPENQPLIDTGALMKSVTEAGAKESIEEQTERSLTLGTTRADAPRHEYGSEDGKEPARPFFDLDGEERAEIEALFAADLDSRVSRVFRS